MFECDQIHVLEIAFFSLVYTVRYLCSGLSSLPNCKRIRFALRCLLPITEPGSVRLILEWRSGYIGCRVRDVPGSGNRKERTVKTGRCGITGKLVMDFSTSACRVALQTTIFDPYNAFRSISSYTKQGSLEM